MNSIQSIFSPEITEALGWTIIHALWQGFLILTCLLVILAILNKNSSQVRYIISFTALLIMFGWSISTFAKAYQYAIEKQELKAQIVNNQDFFKDLTQKQPDIAINNDFISRDIDIKLIKIRAWFQRSFPLFLSLWLIGIGLFTVRLIGGLAYNRRLRALQLLPFEEKWILKLREFATELKITKKVKAYRSPHTSNPITLGFIKPIILFPVKAFTGLSEKEIEAIIAHELAHIVRHDYLFNIIQSLIEILFFYHPAIWSISKHIRNEREHSCDDIAITLTGDKIVYAKALTQAHIFSMKQETLSMAFSRGKGSLLQRIKRIQKQRVMKTNITEGIIAAGIVLSSIFFVSFSVSNQFNPNNIPSKNKIEASNDSLTTLHPTIQTVKVVKINRDSIMEVVEKNIKIAKENQKISKEVEQALEIALSEKDKALSDSIIKDISSTLKEINLDQILKDAKIEIEAAIKEINMDSINLEIKLGLKEAREEMKEQMENNKVQMNNLHDSLKTSHLPIEAAQSGLEVASKVLEDLNIEEIIKTSMEAANKALEMVNIEIENTNVDSIVNVEINRKDILKEKEQLLIEKEQLKKEMDELKLEMKNIKKEIKDASKENQ